MHCTVFIFKCGKLGVRNINNYDCFISLTINRERSFCVVIIAITVIIITSTSTAILSRATPQIFSLSLCFRSHIHILFIDKCANRNARRWSKIKTPHGKLVYLNKKAILRLDWQTFKNSTRYSLPNSFFLFFQCISLNCCPFTRWWCYDETCTSYHHSFYSALTYRTPKLKWKRVCASSQKCIWSFRWIYGC